MSATIHTTDTITNHQHIMNKHPNLQPVQFIRPIAVLLPLLLAFCPLRAEDANTLDMLAPALQDVSALKSSLGTATPVLEDERVVAVKFEFENSSENYPGVEIPTPAEGWDLSSFAAVEAEVENVGDDQILPALSLANQGNPRNNQNGISLMPGQSGVIRLAFGYSWGSPSDEIDLQVVNRIHLFVPPGQSGAFLIKSLRAVRN